MTSTTDDVVLKVAGVSKRFGGLQALLAEWMGNFGAHSRNALRAIVKSGNLY